MTISKIARVVTVATTLTGVVAGEPGADDSGEWIVGVYVNNGQKIRGGHLGQAQAMVGQILSDAGVRLRWKLDTPRRPTEPLGCLARPLEIRVDFVSGIPHSASSKAFAQSFPYAEDGFRIAILVDRLEPFFRSRPLLVTAHLAHVLAHEITHVLQGMSRHSETGLMRTQWNDDDYKQMLKGRLVLEPLDIKLIRLGMTSRQSRNCAAETRATR